MARELPSIGYLTEQMNILIRSARRGRNTVPLDGKYSRLIDSFQHIEDEAERTLLYLQGFNNGTSKKQVEEEPR